LFASTPIKPVGDLFESKLSEPSQISLGEEVIQGSIDPIRRVNLAGQEPLAEVLGRDVHVH
jgi:hypothetical protein